MSTLYAAELVKEKAKKVSPEEIRRRVEWSLSEDGWDWEWFDDPNLVTNFVEDHAEEHLYEVSFSDSAGSTEGLLSRSDAYTNIPNVLTRGH